jgi:hypothetical protein
MELRKFRALVSERGLDDFGASGITFEVDELIKGEIYTQADESRYCKVNYERTPFFVDNNGCSRDIEYCIENKIIEEVLTH